MIKTEIYNKLLTSQKNNGTSFCVLIDPDEHSVESLESFVKAINKAKVDVILVGGSLHLGDASAHKYQIIKSESNCPVLLFPGSIAQLTPHVDAVLYISVVSGRNPQYLIGDHVHAAPIIRQLNLEAIPTAYMLIDGGRVTSVEFMSGTKPIPHDKISIAVAHAMAAEYLGFKLIYLEAGSGAVNTVSPEMIKAVKSAVEIPVMVGGGIKTPEMAKILANAGADFIVTGNVLEKENSVSLLEAFTQALHSN